VVRIGFPDSQHWHWLWIAEGAFVLSPLCRYFRRGQIAWGVISALLSFVSHLSIAFCQTILWIILVTHLRAVLQIGSLVLCHSFCSLHLSCRKWSKPRGALFRSENASLCVASLYAKATEAVKALAAVSTSSTVSAWSRGWIKLEARLQNRSQSVCVSTYAKLSLAQIWSKMLMKIGRWSESSMSDKVTPKRHTLWWIIMLRISPFPCGV
jgi:hypothetical protein